MLSLAVQASALPNAPATALTAREVSDKASAESSAQQVIQWQADGSIRMTAPMQDMQAIVSPSGLALHSVDEAGDAAFGWRLTHLGREPWLAPVSERGSVGRRGDVVALLRHNVIEEYSASADGIRQDFVVPYKPAGDGALTLELAVQGARLAALDDDTDHAIVVTMADGRELHYHALHVTDANGAELAARMKVADTGRLRIAVEDGEAVYPVRIDPTFSDADWTSLADSGFDGGVIMAAVMGGGNLYVGGYFTTAGGGISANRIAQWNGSAWSALGSGMNATVYALAWDAANQRLYAGGAFYTPANRIAQWDGSAWSALVGGGMNGEVHALAWDAVNQRLYAGGWLAGGSGISPNNIAQWDGSAWSVMGSGMSSSARALAWDAENGRLYAGGYFTMAGGTSANRIAMWDGSAWSALGSGMNSTVYALDWDAANQRLYAVGTFTTAGGKPTARVAMAQMRIAQAPLIVTATPSTIGYGDESELGISGGSGSGAESLAITAGAAFCELDGNTVTGIGVGTCTVTATKARDAIYYATSTTVDITVTRASGTVVFDDLSFTYDGSTKPVTAHIAEEPATTCTVPASPIGPNAGDYPVTSTCYGTNYFASGSATASIAKAAGTVTFDALSFTYDGSTKPVTAHITEEPATMCTVPESPIGPNAGSYAVTATCDGINYTASGSATASIAKASQDSLILIVDSTVLFGETSALGTSGGSGTGAVGYAVTDGAAFCEVSGDELTGTGLGTCTVTATKTADTNYLAATATADVTVTPKADLEIAKDASRATAMDGDVVVFSIVAANIGPNDVTGASVIDNPPATLVDVEWACVPPPVSSAACPAAPHDAGTGAMSVLVDLPAGEYLRYDLSGRVQGVVGAEIENTASVVVPSGVTDPDEDNNSSTASVLIAPEGNFADGFETEQGALTVPAAERARVTK